MVVGEKMWEEKGKIIGISVKSIDTEGAHMEETFTSEVKGLGRAPSGRNIGTMNVTQRTGGTFNGTGQGYFTSLEGDSVVWKLYFYGKPEAGKNKTLFLVQFFTASQKLAWMNGVIAIGESITDPKTMEVSGTGYEWK